MNTIQSIDIVAVGFISLLTISVSMTGCESTRTPNEVVVEYLNALNSHSVDSLMSWYSDEIAFSIPALGMHVTGKEALRGVAEYDSVLNTKLQITDIRVQNDTVHCTIRETNHWMDAAGISAAYYPQAIIVVKDERITFIEADMADSSAENFNEVLRSFAPWVQQEHPEIFAAMAPGGEFQFNAENGETMVRLLREWRSSEKK